MGLILTYHALLRGKRPFAFKKYEPLPNVYGMLYTGRLSVDLIAYELTGYNGVDIIADLLSGHSGVEPIGIGYLESGHGYIDKLAFIITGHEYMDLAGYNLTGHMTTSVS